jgi:predicted O-methyltransferase YrrM
MHRTIVATMLGLALLASSVHSRQAPAPNLDARVQAFIDKHRGTWHDLNVPEQDGGTLHDLVVQKKFRRALEIGTSTGHSGVWIGWALAKTGGHLVTIEIDPERHETARANFEDAGLTPYIDARLGNAHDIVPTLEGPFDFVFSDADKEWYTKYFDALWPKVSPGGCFTAHNVSSVRMPGMQEFLDRLKGVTDGTTTIDEGSPEGISITCKAR